MQGLPLIGVSVEAFLEPSREPVGRGLSDSEGKYYLQGFTSAGTLMMRFSAPDCDTVIMKGIPIKMPQERFSLDVTIICCDPGLPVPHHENSVALRATDYLGAYTIDTVCKTCRSAGSIVFLATHEKADAPRCNCGAPGQMVLLGPGEKCPGYGCWRITNHGSIEVYFPCDGIAFAGTKWVLWKEGPLLKGYTSGWTDSGCPPPICEITLTAVGKK